MRTFFSWIDPKYLAILLIVTAVFVYDLVQAGAPDRLIRDIAASNDAGFVVSHIADADPEFADAAWENISSNPILFAPAIIGLLAAGNLNQQVAAMSAINEFNIDLPVDIAWTLFEGDAVPLRAQALRYLAKKGERVDAEDIKDIYYAANMSTDKANIIKSSVKYLPEADAAELLIDALNDASKDVKFAVLDAAKRYGGDTRFKVLIEALQYKDLLAPFAVLDLIELGDERYDSLIGALSDRRSIVRAGVADALGEIGNTDAVQPLMELYTDTSFDVLESAGRAVGKLGGATILTLQLETIKAGYPDTIVGVAAINALGAGKWRPAGPRLLQIASDPGFDRGLRHAAFSALGEMQYDDAFDFIMQQASDSEERDDIRRVAIRAVGYYSNDEALDFLRSALRDVTDYQIRVAAAEGLGRMQNSPEAVNELMLAVSDEDIEIVLNAIVKALGDLGAPKAIPAIEAARGKLVRNVLCDVSIARIERLNKE